MKEKIIVLGILFLFIASTYAFSLGDIFKIFTIGNTTEDKGMTVNNTPQEPISVEEEQNPEDINISIPEIPIATKPPIDKIENNTLEEIQVPDQIAPNIEPPEGNFKLKYQGGFDIRTEVMYIYFNKNGTNYYVILVPEDTRVKSEEGMFYLEQLKIKFDSREEAFDWYKYITTYRRGVIYFGTDNCENNICTLDMNSYVDNILITYIA